MPGSGPGMTKKDGTHMTAIRVVIAGLDPAIFVP